MPAALTPGAIAKPPSAPGASRPAITAVRAMHGLITAFFVSCLSIIYYAGITRRRRGLALAAAAAVSVEGIVVFVNGGECPLGRVHRRVGDERTFFELIMPASLARHAVPALSAVAVGGMLLLALRRPRRPGRR